MAIAELLDKGALISPLTNAVILIKNSPDLPANDKFPPAHPLTQREVIQILDTILDTPAHQIIINRRTATVEIGQVENGRMIADIKGARSLLQPKVFERIRPKSIKLPVIQSRLVYPVALRPAA